MKWLTLLRISILLLILLALKRLPPKKKLIQNDDNSDYGFFVDIDET